MTRSIIKDKLFPYLKRVGIGLLIATFWVAVWQVAALAVGQELLVPSPHLVTHTLWRLCHTADFWRAAGASLLRIATGFAFGVMVGSLLAVLTARVRIANRLLSPLLKIIRATPVASFIILALVWIVTDALPAFIAFLMVVPVVWGNVDKGVRECDPRLLEMARLFRFGRRKTVLHVWIPSVMPYFLSACTTALGLAWKSGIAAEVICRPALSIGRLLQTAKNHLETAEVFAYTLAVIVLSVLLEQGLLWMAKRLGRRFNA